VRLASEVSTTVPLSCAFELVELELLELPELLLPEFPELLFPELPELLLPEFPELLFPEFPFALVELPEGPPPSSLPLSPLPPVGVLAVLQPENTGRTSADANMQEDTIERRITKPLCFGKPTPVAGRRGGGGGKDGRRALARGRKRTRTARVAQTGLEGDVETTHTLKASERDVNLCTTLKLRSIPSLRKESDVVVRPSRGSTAEKVSP
jgi:hypothetical protein